MTLTENTALKSKAKSSGALLSKYVRHHLDALDPEEAANLVQLSALAAELERSNLEATIALESIRETRAQLDDPPHE